MQMTIELLIMLRRAFGQEWEHTNHCWMTFAKYTFVQEAQYTDVTTQSWRCKIIVKECNFFC